MRWRDSNLKPNDGATAICILLDRVEALEAENKKLKKAEKDRWLSDMENGI